MGMQSYGNCELLLNQKKLHESPKFKDIWIRMQILINETDATEYEIANDCFSDDEEAYKSLNIIIKEYIDTAKKEAGIDIYPIYIDSEAEGTDYAGELIWCIEPELKNKIKKYANTWTTWSIFG